MLAVVFGRTSPVYWPGELLSGDVVITTTAQCKILDLTVNYCGMSSVSFVVATGEGKSRTCEKVEEIDTHLDVLHPLVRSYRGVLVEPGVHTYEFSLQLPHLLPSSYKSPYGHISYYVSVHLITSEGTCEVLKPYVIRAPVNISLFLSGQNPKCTEVTQKYGLIRTKSLRLKASVTKTCFVPGEIITVFVEAINETNRDLRYLFCTLKQITHVLVQLQDNSVSQVTKQCLTTLAYKATKGRKYHSWLCQLPSPTFLTPTIAASTIIFVTYSLQVSAKLKRVPIPPDLQIPIVFGVKLPTSPQRSPQPCDPNFVRRVSRQHLPGVHSSIRRRNNLISGVTKIIKHGSRESPTATNPRRFMSVVTQPRIRFADYLRRGSFQPTRSGVSSVREDSNDSLSSGISARGSFQLTQSGVSSVREDSNDSLSSGISARGIFLDKLGTTNLTIEDTNESLPNTNNLLGQPITFNGLLQNNFTDFQIIENEESPTDVNRVTPVDSDEIPDEDRFSEFPRRGSFQFQINVPESTREDSVEPLPTIHTRLRRQPIIVGNTRRGSYQPRSLTSYLDKTNESESTAANMTRKPITVSILRRGSCQPFFSRQDSTDSITSSDTIGDYCQHRPFRRSSFQLQFSVTNLIRDDRSETPPTATNPRRRITVSTQPQFALTPPPSRIGRLQSIASNLTQRLTDQIQALFPS